MCGSVLKRGEGCVLLETLGKVLGGLRIEAVGSEAANKEQAQVSLGIDALRTLRVRAAHLRLVSLDCGRASQSFMMPDMSLP